MLIVFDLDGTLIDSLGDVAAATNSALMRHGLPTFSIDHYREWIGWGARRLLQSALAQAGAEQSTKQSAKQNGMPGLEHDEHLVEQLLADMQQAYLRQPTAETTLYAGIPDLLAFLHQSGIEAALLSNKPHAITEAIVARLFGSRTFTHVQGATPHLPLKPDPTSLLNILERRGRSRAETRYIGDSDVDVELAAAADIAFIGAGWGFRGRKLLLDTGAQTVYDSPQDIQSHLKCERETMRGS